MYLRRPGRERVRIACTAAEPLLSLLSPCCVLMEPISNLQRGAVLFFAGGWMSRWCVPSACSPERLQGWRAQICFRSDWVHCGFHMAKNRQPSSARRTPTPKTLRSTTTTHPPRPRRRALSPAFAEPVTPPKQPAAAVHTGRHDAPLTSAQRPVTAVMPTSNAQRRVSRRQARGPRQQALETAPVPELTHDAAMAV